MNGTADIHTWADSAERALYVSRKGRSAKIGIGSAATGVASAVAFAFWETGVGYRAAGFALVVIASCLAAWAATPYWGARRAYFERIQAEKAMAVDEALRALVGETTEDALPLPELFIFNRRQLDEYQALTKRHATLAFRNAQFAACIGLVLLVGGTVLALGQDSASAQYTAAALSSVGTLVSGYISRTFFRSSRDAMNQLRIYYEEPFLTSRALSAERVIGKMQPPESASASFAVLVERLLQPPPLANTPRSEKPRLRPRRSTEKPAANVEDSTK
jgi:hypothetical protein